MASYDAIGRGCDRFLGFELTRDLAPDFFFTVGDDIDTDEAT